MSTGKNACPSIVDVAFHHLGAPKIRRNDVAVYLSV